MLILNKKPSKALQNKYSRQKFPIFRMCRNGSWKGLLSMKRPHIIQGTTLTLPSERHGPYELEAGKGKGVHRRRTKGKLLCFLFVGLGLFLLGPRSWGATKVFVTDSFGVKLYDETSTESKVITVVSSGEPVEIFLSQDEWSFVRLLGRGENSVEGFILSRNLIDRPPWKTQATPLKDENRRLKERLALLEKELSDGAGREQEISTRLQSNSKALTEIQRKYATLKGESKDYLELRESQRGRLSTMKTGQQRIEKLKGENERMISSKRTRFIAVQVLVLICGFLVGFAMGREQKKRRSLYYY